MQPRLLNDKDPWMLAEHIPGCDVFFFQIPSSCFTSNSSYKFIKPYSKMMATFKKFDMHFYFSQRNSHEVAESILQALLKRPTFGPDLNKNIEHE